MKIKDQPSGKRKIKWKTKIKFEIFKMIAIYLRDYIENIWIRNPFED